MMVSPSFSPPDSVSGSAVAETRFAAVRVLRPACLVLLGLALGFGIDGALQQPSSNSRLSPAASTGAAQSYAPPPPGPELPPPPPPPRGAATTPAPAASTTSAAVVVSPPPQLGHVERATPSSQPPTNEYRAWVLYPRHGSPPCEGWGGASSPASATTDWINGSTTRLRAPLPPKFTLEEASGLLPPDGASIVRPALGTGVLLTKRAVWGNLSSAVSSCSRHLLRPSVAAANLSGSSSSGRRPLHVLAVGHSHTRYCLSMWCMIARGGDACGLLDKHERNVTAFRLLQPQRLSSTAGPVDVTFLQSNFDLRNKLWQLIPALRRHQNGVASTTNAQFPNATADMPPFGKFAWPSQPVHRELAATFDGRFSSLDVPADADESAADIAALAAVKGPPSTWPLTALEQRLLDAFHNESTAAAMKPVDAIVVSRGAWDMLFLDRNPATVAVQLARGLRLLQRLFPEVRRVVLHMPHWHAWNPPRGGGGGPGGKGGGKRAAASAAAAAARANVRRTCFSEPRQQLWRDVSRCALHIAATVVPAHENHTSVYTPFDFYEATKTDVAQRFVDGLGHHYLDAVLEEMSFQLWDTVAEENGHHERHGDSNAKGAEACARVAAEAERRRGPQPECSCMQERAGEDGCQRGGKASLCCRIGRMLPIKARRS